MDVLLGCLKMHHSPSSFISRSNIEQYLWLILFPKSSVKKQKKTTFITIEKNYPN